MLKLQEGNTKVGRKVWTFSLPPVHTCPGKTPACESVCYAIPIYWRWPNVKRSWSDNLERAKRGEQVDTSALQAGDVVRIHVSGDFFEPTYVNTWVVAAQKRRDVTFFVYTRSWRDARFEIALSQLVLQPNVYLYLSADQDSGMPGQEQWGDFRVAWMMLNDEDLPPAPVHVVFREHPRTIMKRATNSIVCPVENGPGRHGKLTCDKCRWCFRAEPNFAFRKKEREVESVTIA